MESPALISLVAVSQYPPSHVGEQAVLLAELAQAGVPTADTQIITTDVLHRLSSEIPLAEILKPLLHDSRWLNADHHTQLRQEILTALKHITLPTWFSQPILEWYHQQPTFVRVAMSTSGFENLEHHNVHGEANLLDSIVALWASQAQVDQRSKEFKLFVRPIMLQHQGQPTASGIAYTEQHTGKHTVIIKSMWGVYQPNHPELKPDTLVVDIRTDQVIERHLNPQYVQLERSIDALKEKPVLHYSQTEFSLTNPQAEELAKIITKTKRLLFQHQQAAWSLVGGQFILHNVETAIQTVESSLKVLLTGQAVHNGIVGGTVKVISSTKDLIGVTLGDVLVVSELTSEISRSFAHISAVVCDKGIRTPELMTQLKKQHIACIINTHHASQTLHTGQRVIVDANAGKILQAPVPLTQDSLAPLVSSPTATKLYVSAGNPENAREYATPDTDGVGVLRSEYTYARFGDHPVATIRSSKRTQLKKALHETIAQFHAHSDNKPVIFRSLNMTSQEARALAHAENYEPEEANPYLGYRGSLKMLHTLELLDFELGVIKEYLDKHRLPLGYMPSFVRAPSELQLVHNHMKPYRFHHYPHYQFWVQLNTPENILNIDHYLLVPVDGFSINIRSIHALLHGIDPDEPELYSLYPLDLGLFERLLGELVKKIKKNPHAMRGNRAHPEVVMHLEDNNTNFVTMAVKLGFTGVTVKPSFMTGAKHWLREAEAAQLTR